MPPDPKLPPTRDKDDDYHFHTYDYENSADRGWFELSDAQPDRGMLQFYSLVQDLQGLLTDGQNRKVPNIKLSDVAQLSADGKGRSIKALSLGSNDPNAPTVVFTGGIHAREWIAPEFVYLLAEYLIIHYTTTPKGLYETKIRDLVNSRRIHIIPMLNPNGNHYTVFDTAQGARLWRKNRRVLPRKAQDWETALKDQNEPNPPFRNVQAKGNFAHYEVPDYDGDAKIPPNPAVSYREWQLPNGATGVDLNRNYNTAAWGYNCAVSIKDDIECSAEPAADIYFGPRHTSEEETGSIEQFLADATRLVAMIDYHSYGQLILYPSEAFDKGAVDSEYKSLGGLLWALVRSKDSFYYSLGSPRALVKYDATGTIIDHAAQLYQTRAFAIELDPPRGTPNGFELPENRIRTVFEKNIRGALAVIEASNAEAVPQVKQEFMTWDVYGRGNQLPVKPTGEHHAPDFGDPPGATHLAHQRQARHHAGARPDHAGRDQGGCAAGPVRQ